MCTVELRQREEALEARQQERRETLDALIEANRAYTPSNRLEREIEEEARQRRLEKERERERRVKASADRAEADKFKSYQSRRTAFNSHLTSTREDRTARLEKEAQLKYVLAPTHALGSCDCLNFEVERKLTTKFLTFTPFFKKMNLVLTSFLLILHFRSSLSPLRIELHAIGKLRESAKQRNARHARMHALESRRTTLMTIPRPPPLLPALERLARFAHRPLPLA